MLRSLLLLLSAGSFGAAAYFHLAARNSFSSYSTSQLEVLTRELEVVARGSDLRAQEARISRTLLEDERHRRTELWSSLAGGAALALAAVFVRGAGRGGSSGTSDEDLRLLARVGGEARTREPAPPAEGTRQHAAALLGVAATAPASVVEAAFAAQLRERRLEDLDGLAPALRSMVLQRRAELERARDLSFASPGSATRGRARAHGKKAGMSPSLAEQCARMLMVGFPGGAPDDGVMRMLAQGVFGVILFKRNVGSVDATQALCAALRRAAPGPVAIAVDQEGGRVARLRGSPFTALPPMREVGRHADPALARRVGRLLAYELRAVGFDWDFAPVLDVDTNPKNPVIGDRALHREAAEVARLGVAMAQGLEEGGVASCGKHFPGHGDTDQDSHQVLPRLRHSLERLRAVELVPFGAYARAGLASLMTAHVVFEAVDPNVPATLSARVLQQVLRQELGFRGVLVSDDLEMKAVADHYPIEEAAVQGALAGVDLFLVCHHEERQQQALEALVHAVESGRLPRARVEEANARLEALTARFAPFARLPQPELGGVEHQSLAAGLTSTFRGADPTEG